MAVDIFLLLSNQPTWCNWGDVHAQLSTSYGGDMTGGQVGDLGLRQKSIKAARKGFEGVCGNELDELFQQFFFGILALEY